MRELFISVLELTLPVSALIVLLLALSPVIKRSYVSKWRYYMWMFVTVRLLLPFGIDWGGGVKVTVPEPAAAGAAGAASASAGVDMITPAAALWLAGAAVFAAYQAFEYIRFRKLSRRWSRDVRDEAVLASFERAKEDIGAGNGIRLMVCKAVSTPMIFGIAKPVLLLPPSELGAEELAVIFRHELVHYKRRDIWYKLLLTAARTLYWFDPPVHLMARAANRDIELACDAEVVKGRDEAYRKHYCEAILRLVHNGSQNKTALSTCFIISRKSIMERFTNILDMKLKKNGAVMFIAVGASIILSGGAVTIAAERTGIEESIRQIERETAALAETEAPAGTAPASAPAASAEAPEEEAAETETAPQQETRRTETEAVSPQLSDRDGERSAAYEDSSAQQSYPDGYGYGAADYAGNDVDNGGNSSAAYAAAAEEEPPGHEGRTEPGAQPESEESGGASVGDVSIGSGRSEVYDSLGEPDTTSRDGSRETYSLEDGSTAILHYDGDVLGDGYIVE